MEQVIEVADVLPPEEFRQSIDPDGVMDVNKVELYRQRLINYSRRKQETLQARVVADSLGSRRSQRSLQR
jgi:hypothetical protein